MKKYGTALLVILVATAGYAQTEIEIANLHTFAKVYGYVKYFHPSDEASAIAWDKFAIYGAGEVIKCKDQEALLSKLNELFAPIAPTARFFLTADSARFDPSIPSPDNKEDYQLTYWQHKGVGLGMQNQNGIYQSVRINRIPASDGAGAFGNIATYLSANPYRGKPIKFSGKVKLVSKSGGTGHLWLRVDLGDREIGFFDNMNENPITADEWRHYEIIGKVDTAAQGIALGSFLLGEGKLLVDDLQLFYQDSGDWKAIPVGNSDFEQEDITSKTVNSPWTTVGESHHIAVTETDFYSGKKSAVIEFLEKTADSVAGALFDAHPAAGERIEKSIGNGLSCSIPLSLYCNDQITYPQTDPDLVQDLQEAIGQVDITPASLTLKLGNLINAWNVFQHFYPYFDVVNVDWHAALDTALKKAYSDNDYDDFLVTLQEFTAPLRDGHIFVSGGTPRQYAPPISWEWLEDRLVITQVFDESIPLHKGEVIVSVDGIPAKAYFDTYKKRISAGTEGWLHYRAQSMSLMGAEDTEIQLTTQEKTIALKRNMNYRQDISPKLERNSRAEYRWIEEDLIYLNIGKIEMTTIDSLMPQLQEAKAIICDLRGYPKSNHGFISHLLTQPDTTSSWMQIPQVIYPDRENIREFFKANWMLPAEAPHLDAKIVFITDGSAISYAESYMGYIEGYDLATIVGQPTAGTNGNVNRFSLPGGFSLNWTGMKVLKHNGSQHHAIGIIPDILVPKTRKGVLEGRDEFLEKAIEVAKGGE